MTEEIRDKYNKLLGTITTNSQGLKEVRNTYNVCLAVYDPKRNETRNKYNVVLTKYDSLISILHEHINSANEKKNNGLKHESRSNKSAEQIGESIAEGLISGLKTISFSDLNKAKESFTLKKIYKEFTSIRKGVLFWAGMALLVPIVLMILLLLVVKLTS